MSARTHQQAKGGRAVCTECGEVGHNRRRHALVPIFDKNKGGTQRTSGGTAWERMRSERARSEGMCDQCWSRPALPGVLTCAKHNLQQRWRAAADRAEKRKARGPIKRAPRMTEFKRAVLNALAARGEAWSRPMDLPFDRKKSTRTSGALRWLVEWDLAEEMIRHPGRLRLKRLYRVRPRRPELTVPRDTRIRLRNASTEPPEDGGRAPDCSDGPVRAREAAREDGAVGAAVDERCREGGDIRVAADA